MFVIHGNLEIHFGIYRYPFGRREGKIISIPFETIGTIEILIIIEIYSDTIFVDSFADILDVEDEILI
ncbi:MAG: hypothetical protein WCJ45_01910 [bacterium]